MCYTSLFRIEQLVWDEGNIAHLHAAHQVSPDEVEEVFFGENGEESHFRVRRDGEFYMVWGETGGGRLLLIVGELLPGRRLRVFGAA